MLEYFFQLFYSFMSGSTTYNIVLLSPIIQVILLLTKWLLEISTWHVMPDLEMASYKSEVHNILLLAILMIKYS